MRKKHRFSTLTVHAGEEEGFPFGAVATPIYQTSTFAFRDTEEVMKFQKGESSGYLYTRYGNPTIKTVEDKLAALEGGESALLLSSGMAAISTAVLSLISAGEEIVSTQPVYGGTHHLFKKHFPRLGIKVRFLQMREIDEAERVLTPRTRLFFCETPTNPNLRIADIRKIVRLARERGIPVMVDNTFATPCNQNPLSLGADLVVHSGTKYLGGHSDLVAGAIVGSKVLIDRARETMKVLGGCIDPLGAFLLLRGLKTLALRVERQNRNALEVAKFLSQRNEIRRVFYPGLPAHPQHDLAKNQMRGFGGVVCFEVKGGLDSATKVVDNLRLFKNAASLGGVESLATLPILTSHSGFEEEELKQADVTPGMVRLSCGIEDQEDLIEDLRRALDKVR